MPLTGDFYDGKIILVDVIKTEGRGIDVNLAVQMAVDAVRNKFDYAMLFSNDSDMAYAVQIVQIASCECKKKVGLYIVRKAVSFKVLRENVSYIRSITPTIFSAHQFPDEIRTQSGRIIKKLKDWYKPLHKLEYTNLLYQTEYNH